MINQAKEKSWSNRSTAATANSPPTPTAATPCCSLHELVGEADGPTIGIVGCDPRQREYRLAGDARLYRALKDVPLRAGSCCCRSPMRGPLPSTTASRRSTSSISTASSPATASGNYTQQLAAAITREFLEKIDVHIDLHAGTDRPTVDYVYIWNDEPLSPRLRLEDPLPADARARRARCSPARRRP